MSAPEGVAAAHPARGLRARLLGHLIAAHPVPSAMYVVAVGLMALVAAAASRRAIAPLQLAQVLGAVACTQVAIGSLNDYRDRALDAVAKPSKPIPRGLISPRGALAQVWVASVGAILLSLPLGLVPFILTLLIEALGLAYDLGFKGTWVSGLLYALYFPLIPLLAWSVFGRWQPFLPWLVPLGAAVGIAMNVANSLPDLEQDRAAGVRGLPHLLGRRWALVVAWAVPPLCVIVLWLLALTGLVSARLPGLAVATLAALGTTAIAMLRYERNPTARTLRANFYLQAIGVIGLAVGWLVAVAL